MDKSNNKEDKKIDIITFQCAYNYGAILQAFALQKKLKELSNDVKIINYRNQFLEKGYRLISLNTKNVKTLIKSILSNIYFFKSRYKKNKNFKKFINKNLNLTMEYNSEEELKKNPPEADIYVTGSDQVWNSQITKGLQDSYTLNFGEEDVKRISYAASIGNSKIDSNEKKDYKDKISKLDYISVREEEGKKILEEFIEKPIEVVLDPTLLLTKEDWDSKIKGMEKEKEKYILAYVVDPDEEYIKIVNYLSEKTGLKVIHFSKKNKGIANILRNAYTDGPLSFLNLIKNAEYVVATSFHATIFSIIFNKKFFVIPHKITGSRVYNLLTKLEIENRAIKNLEEFKKIDYDEEIDYEKTEMLLEKERNKSLDWIKKAIN